MSEPILRVDSVRKAFASVQAVDGVSLEVHEGEVFGLLGPNGAGKSTLIRIVVDIYRPDEGAVALFGSPMDRQDLDRIGYLPEERGLYRKRKIIQVLTYLGQLKGLSKSDAETSADHWLGQLGMSEHRDSRVETLSKGNQQKIQLIGTLVGCPRLLIWDEPFSGLDPVNVAQVRDMIRGLRDSGMTVVLSTHLMDQAEILCDRVALVDHGHVVLQGTVDEAKAAVGARTLEEAFLRAVSA
ncbi:MAG: ATP-binding cassette domain-containing protein [Proteobacteria bacterium]|nr:ATP-binding cassette domain-containing protein [Pseudomonadota bacterium]